MHTETLAVAAVMREISRTQRLVPFLNAHDKEPVWDGYVAVYRTGAPYRNDDLLRRIPVQIKADKGKTDAKELQYPVRRVDLRLYQTDNPTVFFVVRWDETGETVYCAAFTQEEAAALFPDRDAETEVSVRFTPFPHTDTEKERLFLKLASGDAEDILAEPVERRPLSDTDIFRYNAGLVDFYGREAEREALDAFLNAKPESALCADFLWWGVIGPGGAGKSRLGLEWGKQIRERGWTVRTLRSGDYKDLDALTERHSGPLLLIADYARQHAGALGAWMESLCDAELTAPVRLLLLERDEGADAAGETAWEKELYHAGDEGRLRRARHERLLPLPKLDKSPLEALILDFAARLRERDANLPALTEAEAKKLVKRLGELDRDCRPLYAMILTDAYLRDPAAAHWTQEALLDGLVLREREQLKKAVQSLQPAGERLDTALFAAALRLRRLATALGASNDRGLEELLKLEPAPGEILRKKAEQYNAASVEELLLYLGLLRFQEGNALVPALRPDLLGEYALLHWLTDGSTRPQERAAYYASALGDRELRAFYQRLYADYAPLLNGRPARWEGLLPAALPVEGDAASLYTLLLYDGFTRCTDKEQRQRLLTETARYADAVQEETPAAGNIFNNLGLLYTAMGDYPRALEYHQKALAIFEKALGPEHPDTATDYNNLGAVYHDMGDWPRALEYYQKALAIREKALGPKHPDTAQSYNNLGTVYHDMGDWPRALEYHQKALAIREKALGPEHPSTAASYNNLGTVYRATGDYPRALEYHRKALAIREKTLGPEHPSTATSYNNLGSVYHNMGDWPRALECCQKALAIREKALGPEHPDTANSCNNLGGVYMDMGDFPHALEYIGKAAAIVEAVLGPAHPRTKLYKENLNFLKLLAASADDNGGDLPSKQKALFRPHNDKEP